MVPTAYEGKENYIFVSYAHSDRDEVFKVLSEMENKGYRFWYDDGIAPGSEWPEDIANHLNGSYVVLAFITSRAAASHNCRREVNYALAKNKHFLSVILEPTEMSAGLEMQLSAQQSIIRYNYTSWDAFINKLLSSPYMKPCRNAAGHESQTESEPEKEPEPQTEPELQNEPEPQTEPESQAEPELQAESAGVRPADSDAVQKKPLLRRKKAAAADDSTGGKKKKLRIVIIAAAVILAAICIYSAATTVIMSWGEKFSTGDTFVQIKGQVFEQDDIDKLSRLKNISSLYLTECDFSGCDESLLFESIPECSVLEITDCKGIDDYSFLSSLKPYTLIVRGDPGFTNLFLVNTEGLKTLDISGSGVSDIEPLASALKLEELNISNSAVTDIDPISDLEDLTALDISGCKVKDPGRTFKSLSLIDLNAADCGMKDMSAFSDCTILERLDISGNPEIKDLSWLNRQNGATLEELNVADTGLDSSSLDCVSYFTNIKRLELDGSGLEDLAFCKDHSSLVYLSAQGCGLKDISGLEGCSSLSTALLSFNEIADIGGLTSLSVREDGYYTKLDLSFNALKDISGLPAGSYHTLLLAGNDKNLAATLSPKIKAYNISLDYYDGILKSGYAGTGNFNHIYIDGTPADQKLNVQDHLTTRKVDLVTMEEFYTEILANNKFSYNPELDFSYAIRLYEAQK